MKAMLGLTRCGAALVLVWSALSGCGATAIDDGMDAAVADLRMPPSREDLVMPRDLTGTCSKVEDCAGGATACCDGRCTDVMVDPGHCGRCGVSCGGGMCCSGMCADTNSDISNCGACGKHCAADHGKPGCSRGMCFLDSCDPGWADCSGGMADGCETPTDADINHCGGCATVCNYANGNATCMAGTCMLASCKPGYSECNANLADGCEVNTGADPKNCGACGSECLQRPNAQVKCLSNACTVQSCNGSFLDCDKDSNNGCEVDGNVSVKNCGACGNACPQNTVCKAGICDCPPCNFPNARMTSCQKLVCVIDACFPNYFDCDKLLQNGCEANINSDARNCGGCGNVCGANTPNCLGGMCTKIYASCAAILGADPQSKDGPYPIDPDGIGPVQQTTVYCDMTTSGGGWTIVYASQALDGDVGMVSDAQIPGNALNYEAYNTSRALKMAINAVATESLLKRKLDSAWLKVNAPLYDGMLDTPNTHLHRVVTLTASNGVSAQGAIGYSNYNTPSGGDYGISMYPDAATCNGVTVNGFDHHSATYYHLNCGCQRQYLYSYSSGIADNDQAYNINTGLGSWTATQGCASIEGGGIQFYAAMR